MDNVADLEKILNRAIILKEIAGGKIYDSGKYGRGHQEDDLALAQRRPAFCPCRALRGEKLWSKLRQRNKKPNSTDFWPRKSRNRGRGEETPVTEPNSNATRPSGREQETRNC